MKLQKRKKIIKLKSRFNIEQLNEKFNESINDDNDNFVNVIDKIQKSSTQILVVTNLTNIDVH